jgi:transcriptional regulator with XRE-family HTH domain
MKSQQEIGAELREYLLLNKVHTQRELAAKLGISATHLSNYLRGSERISRKVADRIVELWPEIREAFILTGDGPLLRGGVNINQTHNTNTGDGAGAIHLGSDDALRQQVAELTARLERAEEEKARLLGIIETITGR